MHRFISPAGSSETGTHPPSLVAQNMLATTAIASGLTRAPIVGPSMGSSDEESGHTGNIMAIGATGAPPAGFTLDRLAGASETNIGLTD